MRWSVPNPVQLGLLAILTLVAPARAQLGLNEGPLVRFETREHFFGEVSQGEHVEYTFEFQNGGTDTLKVEQVESSCGCTAVAPRDRAIAPGASSGIQVVFHTRDYKGERSQVVAVYTNDPTEPRVDLVVHATVMPLIQSADDWLDFGEVTVGTKKTVGTLVTADPGTDFEILGFEGDKDLVDWNVVPASAPDKIAYRVEATLRKDAPIGRFSERVLMKVKHPAKEEERIGIRGHVFSYFLIDDPRVEFHTVKSGRTVSRSLEIRCDSERKYHILSVKTNAPYFSGNLVDTGAGYRLDMTLDTSKVIAEEPRFRFREFAILETDDPGQPEIFIELVGVVKK
ncbi:MAG: DUF1573 domain-containing protein [Candidatus Eisenbacteria bacterium]|nr:DUF1573 domain-containing protein [Candidatus Eisenbacteria bacterium]